MAPIRVGLVGLTKASGLYGDGGWALVAHFPYLTQTSDYEIVAVLNSSIESARAAIEFHKLGPNVKAYGRPEDLAKDPNVDLVAVVVNVKKHYALAKPAIEAGKNVLIEWPLADTTAKAEELAELARKSGSKGYVGLQTRADPLTKTLKTLIDGGKIGKVLSTEVVGSMGLAGAIPQTLAPFLGTDGGATFATVLVGHFLGAFTHVLGSFSKLKAVMEVQQPTLSLLDDTFKVVKTDFVRTGADHLLAQGILESGAVASIVFKHAGPTQAKLRWIITGTDGEIEITTPPSIWHMGSDGVTIKFTGHDKTVEDIPFALDQGSDPAAGVDPRGANTARLYENIARDDVTGYATFDEAVVVHRLLDAMIKDAGSWNEL